MIHYNFEETFEIREFICDTRRQLTFKKIRNIKKKVRSNLLKLA
jgi:hypothetical protein